MFIVMAKRNCFITKCLCSTFSAIPGTFRSFCQKLCDPCRNSHNGFHLVGYNLLYVHVFPGIHILYDGLLDARSHRWHTTIGFYKFWMHDYPIVDS